MPNEDTKEKPPIVLTPEEGERLNDILKQYADMLVRLSQRDSKRLGGIVNNIDKDIRTPESNPVLMMIDRARVKLSQGGFIDNFPGPEDEEGQIRYFINVLTPPRDAMEQYYLEQLERDLEKLKQK